MEVLFYYIGFQGTNIKDRIIEVRIMEVQFYSKKRYNRKIETASKVDVKIEL